MPAEMAFFCGCNEHVFGLVQVELIQCYLIVVYFRQFVLYSSFILRVAPSTLAPAPLLSPATMAFSMPFLRAFWRAQTKHRDERLEQQHIEYSRTGNRMRHHQDVHMWCETASGEVKDPFRLNTRLEQVWGRGYFEPPLKLVRRAWGTVPEVHLEMIKYEKARYLRYAQKDAAERGVATKRVLQELLGVCVGNMDKIANRCISIAALQSMLYGWTIKVGSLGWECDLPGVRIWWEFGNGGAECPPEFATWTLSVSRRSARKWWRMMLA